MTSTDSKDKRTPGNHRWIPGARFFVIPVTFWLIDYVYLDLRLLSWPHLYHNLLIVGVDSALAQFYMSLGYGILRAFILILSSLTVLKYCQMGPSEIGWALPRRFPWVVSLGILVGMADHILGNFIGLTLPSMAFFLRLPYGMTWSLDPVWNQLANPSAFHNLLFQWSLVVLSEELAYRGVIQSVLRKKMEAWPSIILASLAFSCCHFAPFWDPHRPGFSELTICRFLALFVAGLIHGWLREWTGSLWAPIASHGASNFIGFEMDVRFRMI